jgi:hypothetical protein
MNDCCNHACREGRDCPNRKPTCHQAPQDKDQPFDWITEIPVVPYLVCALLIGASAASITFFPPAT